MFFQCGLPQHASIISVVLLNAEIFQLLINGIVAIDARFKFRSGGTFCQRVEFACSTFSIQIEPNFISINCKF